MNISQDYVNTIDPYANRNASLGYLLPPVNRSNKVSRVGPRVGLNKKLSERPGS